MHSGGGRGYGWRKPFVPYLIWGQFFCLVALRKFVQLVVNEFLTGNLATWGLLIPGKTVFTKRRQTLRQHKVTRVMMRAEQDGVLAGVQHGIWVSVVKGSWEEPLAPQTEIIAFSFLWGQQLAVLGHSPHLGRPMGQAFLSSWKLLLHSWGKLIYKNVVTLAACRINVWAEM